MAGIGEKPAIRSGPYCLMVWALAAAISSVASSQPARMKPPRPRRDTQLWRLAGSSTIERQAATGVMVLRASRQWRRRRPRMSGYLIRVPEYRYQL